MAVAAYAGQLDVVQYLADRTTDLNAQGKYCMTPMALAAYAGQLEVVQDLAERNAKLQSG